MGTNLFKFFILICTGILFTGFTSPPTKSANDPFVVVLDAGHGGHDPGNRGNGYYEKDIALSIVLKVGEALEKIPDVKVIYTRKTDVFVTLAGRAKIANDSNADVFISIHCNSHSSQAQGTETFVLGLHRNKDNLEVAMRENSVIYLEEDYEVTYGGFDPNSPESYIGFLLMQEEYLDQSILLASFVQKNFTNDLHRVNRGVKQAGFLVLRETVMPSVLIETGFLTNDEEGAFLNSNKGQNKIAASIVDGIIAYKNNINYDMLDDLSKELPVPVETTVVEKPSNNFYKDVTFRVQLAATSKKLDPGSSRFHDLDVTRTKEGKYYKYYFGATSSYSKIRAMHTKAKENGFPTSYIVAFKNGAKISVNEALKQK
ncbi:MAG TPA: N-acetylmuramoyl-L-alanine amidase [Salinimicrobium sp.]|nr:N-acetylmuramoyl-L-alanine amidase [Salinimicrobium sp.]